MRSLTTLSVCLLLYQFDASFGASIDTEELKEFSVRTLKAECGGSEVDLRGHNLKDPVSMISPGRGWLNEYNNNEDCTYTFKVPAKHQVNLDVEYFRLGGCRRRGGDKLIWTVDGTRKKKWCRTMRDKKMGFKARDWDYILTARFKTDSRGRRAGFKIQVYLKSRFVSTTSPPNPPSSVRRCGRKISRIVGGEDVLKGSIPWQVAVKTRWGEHFCGGTLITPWVVLTAAHCIDTSRIIATVKEHHLGQDQDQVDHSVRCFKNHPRFNSKTYQNDFSLLILDKKVDISDTALPACLPTRVREYDGLSLTVSGWGTTSSGGTKSDVLQSTVVKGINRRQCDRAYGSITNQMMCAATPGKDSCQGDSGGPLTLSENAVTTIVGVVSFGHGCASPKFPGVYAKVDTVLDWIRANANTDDGSKPSC